MELFTLRAQVLGEERIASAEEDGSGIALSLTGRRLVSRTAREALRVSRDYLGPYLADADRRGKPWGLYAGVADVAAVYGNWPLLPAPASPSTSRDELVTRIRREYRDGSASSALENALRIIEAYQGSSGRRAA